MGPAASLNATFKQNTPKIFPRSDNHLIGNHSPAWRFRNGLVIHAILDKATCSHENACAEYVGGAHDNQSRKLPIHIRFIISRYLFLCFCVFQGSGANKRFDRAASHRSKATGRIIEDD